MFAVDNCASYSVRNEMPLLATKRRRSIRCTNADGLEELAKSPDQRHRRLQDSRAISPFNLFGYATQFDRDGRSGSNTIDFEAMALYLLSLERAARARGIGIRRVIFDDNLQPKLASTGSGR